MPSTSPVSKSDLDMVVRREDVADAVNHYRRSARSAREWFVAIGGIALVLGIWAVGLASDSTSMLLATFVAGWLALAALNIRARHRYSAEISRLGLACPSCREPIVEMIEWRGLPKRADAILATGRCPTCGGECFAPEA
jgi:hypothetical protein